MGNTKIIKIEDVANGVVISALDNDHKVVYQRSNTGTDADIYTFADFLFYLILAYAPKRVVQDLTAPKIQIVVNMIPEEKVEGEVCLQ